MTTEEIIIAIVRVSGALPVLRWALAGALIAIAVDFSDLFLMNLLKLGGVGNYQALDKWLDVAYMLTFLVAALRWHGPAKTIAIALFAFRAIGFTAFELTGERWVLVAFPNAFEFWFLLVVWLHHYRPAYTLTMRHALLWLIPAMLLKETHELILHGWRGLDRYTAVEVVQTWWDWLTGWVG